VTVTSSSTGFAGAGCGFVACASLTAGGVDGVPSVVSALTVPVLNATPVSIVDISKLLRQLHARLDIVEILHLDVICMVCVGPKTSSIRFFEARPLLGRWQYRQPGKQFLRYGERGEWCLSTPLMMILVQPCRGPSNLKTPSPHIKKAFSAAGWAARQSGADGG
jgi:hypothetical protein